MARTRRRLADPLVRKKFQALVKARHERGTSIRATAEEHHLSYGTTRRLLIEAGVTLGSRRGLNRAPQGPPQEPPAHNGHYDRNP